MYINKLVDKGLKAFPSKILLMTSFDTFLMNAIYYTNLTGLILLLAFGMSICMPRHTLFLSFFGLFMNVSDMITKTYFLQLIILTS